MSKNIANTLTGAGVIGLVVVILVMVWIGVGSSNVVAGVDAPKSTVFTLASSAFKEGGELPIEYTGDGDGIQPPVSWSNLPSGTKSIAVVMHHRPGPGDEHVYFMLYNIAPDVKELKQGAKDVGTFGANTVNGKASYSPPHSKGPGIKTYTITAYALSSELKFDASGKVTLDQLEAAIKDKTLAKADLNVTYDRTDKINNSDQRGQPNNPQGGQGNGRGQGQGPGQAGRGGPPEQRALQNITLDEAQTKKIATVMDDFRQKKQKLEADLLAQMKTVLTEEQFKQYSQDFTRRPPPPPQDGGGQGGPDGQGGGGPGGDGNGPPPPPPDGGNGNDPPPPPPGQ